MYTPQGVPAMSPKYNPLKFCCRLHHIQEGDSRPYTLIQGSVSYFIPSGGENIECIEHTGATLTLTPPEGGPYARGFAP